MFWKVSSFSSGSAVEAILDKQTITIEELLDEDELVQECKALNARLIAYLKQAAVLSKLITYAIDPPKSWTNERQQQRYPLIASEVLCCEVDGVYDALVNDENLLAQLFAFLDQDKPLNSLRAGYFARVVVSLLTKCSTAVMSFVYGKPWVLRLAVDHIETFSILECLQNMLGAADQSPGNAAASDLHWLPSTNVLPDLFSKLHDEAQSSSRENVGKLLTQIGRSRNCPLTSLLPSPQYLQPMLENAFQAQHGNQLKQALHVCIALLDRQQQQQQAGQVTGEGLRQSVERAAAAAAELESKLEAETIDGVCLHADRLAALLDAAPETPELGTSYGVLQPPLGSSRLAVIALLDSLLSTGSAAAEQAIINSDALPRCLQLVIDYPFNSILHHLVSGLLTKALGSGPPTLLDYLFRECRLLHWLLTIPTLVTPKQHQDVSRETDDAPKSQRAPLRAGYLGHITQLANTLQAASQERPEVAEHVEPDSHWQDYLSSQLQPQNQLQDVEQWSFGRPEAKFKRTTDDGGQAQEDVPLISLENGASPDANGHDRYGSLEYDEEDHILFQQNQGVDDNVNFDSDEEDDSGRHANGLERGGLASFPVESWEDTWDDSDAPASGQLGEGWGQMANQLYKNQWGTQEHSGWSDDDDTDPDLPLRHTNVDDHDDSVVLVDDNDMEDGDAVMVDALEALRLTQPHTLPNDRLSQLTQAAEASNDRPQTAKGGNRHITAHSMLSSNEDSAGREAEGRRPESSSTADHRSHGNEGEKEAVEGNQSDRPRSSIWALFGGKDRSRHDDGPSVASHAAGDSSASSAAEDTEANRLIEDSKDRAHDNQAIQDTADNGDAVQQEDAIGQATEGNEQSAFSSSLFWKTPLLVPDEIEAA